MLTTTVTNFRKNIYAMIENTICYNEPAIITTKSGNAVMISEEEYRGLLETLRLSSNPELKQKLVDGLNTPLSDTLSEEEVSW